MPTIPTLGEFEPRLAHHITWPCTRHLATRKPRTGTHHLPQLFLDWEGAFDCFDRRRLLLAF